MCFSDHKVNTRYIQQSYDKMKAARIQYTKNRQLSKYTLSMIEYMQNILNYKVGSTFRQDTNYNNNNNSSSLSCLSCLPCFRDMKNRNVRKQFQKAFQKCLPREQLDYYRKFINYMTNSDIPLPYAQNVGKQSLNSDININANSNINSNANIKNKMQKSTQQSLNINNEIIFEGLIKGKLYWSQQSTMRLVPNRFSIYYKQIKNINEICLNLRNYILRESKQSKANSYVLQSIVPIQPSKIRFAIPQYHQNCKQIIKKIKQMADKALFQNVQQWRQPIGHILNPRAKSIQKKQKILKQHMLNNENKSTKKIKQQQGPQVNFGKKDINDPLMKHIKDKAKMGIMKKAKQFNETLIDPNSKKSSLNGLLPGTNLRNPSSRQTIQQQTNNNQQQFDQQEIILPQENGEDIQPNINIKNVNNNNNNNNNNVNYSNNANTNNNDNDKNDFIKNLLNLNNADAFKKKSKPEVLSENQDTMTKISTKKQNIPKKQLQSHQNYVLQPQKTQSQSGFNQIKKFPSGNSQTDINRISQIPKIKQVEYEKADSGKSLLLQLAKSKQNQKIQQINQQQQFGNASEISHDTYQSFCTIPETFR